MPFDTLYVGDHIRARRSSLLYRVERFTQDADDKPVSVNLVRCIDGKVIVRDMHKLCRTWTIVNRGEKYWEDQS